MKAQMTYVVGGITGIILSLAIVMYMERTPIDIAPSSYTSSNKSALIEVYKKAYANELNEVRIEENKAYILSLQAAHDLVEAHADSTNSVTSGMRASFQEGIASGYRKNLQKLQSDVPQAITKLHIKYISMLKEMGYDAKEFEQIMCEIDRADKKDTLCCNH